MPPIDLFDCILKPYALGERERPLNFSAAWFREKSCGVPVPSRKAIPEKKRKTVTTRLSRWARCEPSRGPFIALPINPTLPPQITCTLGGEVVHAIEIN